MPNRIDQNPGLPLQKKSIRKAEDTDTRQAIQRHDPEFHRKKKDDEEGGFKDPYEDLTDVSVSALRNFLVGLLETQSPTQNAAPDASPNIPNQPHTARAPVSPQAAAAAQAYQQRVSNAPPQAPAIPAPPKEPKSGTALEQAAANLDRAEVLDLMRELDRLVANGTTSIGLEKGDSFLDSIRDAIARVKE